MIKFFKKSASVFALSCSLFLVPQDGNCDASLPQGTYILTETTPDNLPKQRLTVDKNGDFKIVFHKHGTEVHGTGTLDKTGTSAEIKHSCSHSCPKELAPSSTLTITSVDGIKTATVSWIDPTTRARQQTNIILTPYS